ncbi:Swi3-domain-containing protein [Aureobasidium pullulans]|uniref:Chromosome segregation in meiosis protein n=1 Tax=Aureobasidium pullulans TaxID=5580 RepID=A0A4T0BQ81_AURPU|nr:Swi3-domain-containing protein [Aureobasidium pullulans]
MPAAVPSGVRPTVERDNLDDIFNDDAGIDETFNRQGQDWSAQDDANNNNTNQQQHDVPVDIDEEVKVTKKRKPVAKLDEDRLLSQQGIPKLRKIAKDRIQIKGRGHEFSDMARLLNTYQLWLDDLFPKAKFMDGVSMIEKLGHKKRMQMMRREWIEEGKPKPPREEEDDFVIPTEDAAVGNDGRNNEDQSANTEEQSGNNNSAPEGQSNVGAQGRSNRNPFDEEEPDEDDLDALLAESESMPVTNTSATNNTRPADDQEPDEDELDALMAEDAMNDSAPKSLFGGPVSSVTNTAQRPADEFDDDEEAMAGMDW